MTARKWHHAGVDDIIDDLAWRGLIASAPISTRCARRWTSGRSRSTAGSTRPRPGLHIGNLVQLLTHAPPAAGRAPADRAGRRGDRADRRPERQVGRAGAEPARRSSPGWVERIRGAGRAVPRPSTRRARGADRQQPGLDRGLSAIEFLRDIGKHFPVNRMLDRESVAPGWTPAGISYTEFSYQLLQAMDFLELYRRYGCTLQTGGSDQWGNLTAGRRPDPRVEGGHGACAGHAADHQGRRHQVRQDRERRGLARPRDDAARTRSTSSGSTEDADVRSLLRDLQLPVRTRRSRSWSARPPSGPPRRIGAARAGRGADHAGARRRRDRAGHRGRRPCSARASCAELDERTLAAAARGGAARPGTAARELPPWSTCSRRSAWWRASRRRGGPSRRAAPT